MVKPAHEYESDRLFMVGCKDFYVGSPELPSVSSPHRENLRQALESRNRLEIAVALGPYLAERVSPPQADRPSSNFTYAVLEIGEMMRSGFSADKIMAEIAEKFGK